MRHKIINAVVILCLAVLAAALLLAGRPAAHDETAYERICVEIDTGDGCYFALYADALIDADGDEYRLLISQPELLAYDVTEKYDRGVYVINGKYFDAMSEAVRFIRKSVMDIYDNPAIYYVDSLYHFVMEGTVYTESST